MKPFTAVLFLALIAAATMDVAAQDRARRAPEIHAVSTQRDIPYATNGGVTVKLDLYLPKLDKTKPAPLAVFIHGGGWEHGNKVVAGWLAPVANELLPRGYVVASVDYRLAPEHKWPAFINDVKCAIRFLRANAQKYNIDPQHIGTWGTSAGGHLVALLGTTDANAKLEGDHYLDQSSRVQAVVDLFGPTDLRPLLKLPQHKERGERVFGDANAAAQASPVIYVSRDDPPFLILHGENDTLVPPQQAHILYDKLKETGVPAQLVIVKNGAHGLGTRDIEPSTKELVEMIVSFFDKHLRSTAVAK